MWKFQCSRCLPGSNPAWLWGMALVDRVWQITRVNITPALNVKSRSSIFLCFAFHFIGTVCQNSPPISMRYNSICQLHYHEVFILSHFALDTGFSHNSHIWPAFEVVHMYPQLAFENWLHFSQVLLLARSFKLLFSGQHFAAALLKKSRPIFFTHQSGGDEKSWSRWLCGIHLLHSNGRIRMWFKFCVSLTL